MFCIAGTAPIVPFLPIYARQLGLSSVVVGMIYTLLPIAGMLAKPLFGAIADRFRLQKILFLAFQILTAVTFFAIQFIPEIQTESAAPLARLDCDMATYFKFCSDNIDSCVADRLVAETSNDTMLCEVCILYAPFVLLMPCVPWLRLSLWWPGLIPSRPCWICGASGTGFSLSTPIFSKWCLSIV
jgi:MFS-type transporter involved in bile tolerance (Atg22 family)